MHNVCLQNHPLTFKSSVVNLSPVLSTLFHSSNKMKSQILRNMQRYITKYATFSFTDHNIDKRHSYVLSQVTVKCGTRDVTCTVCRQDSGKRLYETLPFRN